MLQQTVSQYCNSTYGVNPPQLNYENEPVRFGKKNHLWFYGHSWEYKNKEYFWGQLGCWKSGKIKEFKSWDNNKLDKGFKKKFNDQVRMTQNKIKIEKHEKNEKCRKDSMAIWKKTKACDSHEYLDQKNIKAFAARKQNETLYVPLYDTVGMTGLQRIFIADGKTEKKFSYGIKIQGSICPLKPFKDSKLVYLSEGFSTAASIQMAFPNVPSIAAMNANNLVHAVLTIRAINPDCEIILAADDDSATEEKAGNLKAVLCQKKFKKLVSIFPKFMAKTSDHTDFNDLHISEGIEAVQKQLEYKKEDFNQIIPLGHKDKNYFYTSEINQEIVSLNPSSHDLKNLLQLGTKRYWFKNYGKENDDGDIKIDWSEVADDLMQGCHSKGVFDPTKIRGTGVWREGETIIINNGKSILNEPENSEYIYRKGQYSPFALIPNPESYHSKLLNAFQNIHTKEKKEYFYIASWYIQSFIFPVMPWRFHLWLTGEKGSGKSTILRWLSQICVSPLYVKNSTAAGITQEAGSNAKAVIYDESEPDKYKTDAILSIMRENSDNDNSLSLRGTATGNSIKHNTNLNFCFGSIQVPQLNAADKSRIFVVELKSTENQPESDFVKMQEAVEEVEKFRPHIFTSIYKNIDKIQKMYAISRRYLTKFDLEARQRDQISAAIACFSAYLFDNGAEASEGLCDLIINEYNLVQSVYTEDNEEQESELAYSDLMSLIINQRDNVTVARAVCDLHNSKIEHASYESDLGSFGLKLSAGKLFVSSNHPRLLKFLPKYPKLTSIFKRDEKFFDSNARIKPIGSTQSRGVWVKIKEEDLKR